MKKLVLIIFTLILASCSSNVDLAIDNPSKNPVLIKVDSLEVEIPGKDVVWVEMGKGKHTLTIGDSIVKFNFQKSLYMINPLMTEYLQYNEYYGMGDPYIAPSKDSVNYLGVMNFPANEYKVVKDLINPVTWDYGPREVLPEMIEVDATESYSRISKLLDPYEFFEMAGYPVENDSEVVE